MKVRLLTVYSTSMSEEQVPQIRLQGKWLEQHGFKTGKKIIVEERYGELIIRIVTIEKLEE